jgi:hypothetical protein
VNEFVLDAAGDLKGTVLVPDINANGAAELATVVQDVPYFSLMYRPARGEVRDLLTAMTLTELHYGPALPASSMAVMPDMTGNGMPEVAVVNSRGPVIAGLYDSLTADTVSETAFSNLLRPRALDVFPDLDRNGRPELAVLGDNVTTWNNDLLELRDPATGAVTRRFWLGPGWQQIAQALVRDLNGNGSPEVAILRTRPDGRVNVMIRDLKTRGWVSSVDFTPGYTPRNLVVVADTNGNGADELVVFGPRKDGFNQKAIVRDSRTGEWLRDLFFDRNFPGQDFVSCGDIDRNGADDVALLGYNAADGRNRVIVKDTATGQRLATVRFW